jgi:hypothetical protein
MDAPVRACHGGAGIGGLSRETEENSHGGLSVVVANHHSAGTIADSGVPNCDTYSFAVLRQFVARIPAKAGTTNIRHFYPRAV